MYNNIIQRLESDPIKNRDEAITILNESFIDYGKGVSEMSNEEYDLLKGVVLQVESIYDFDIHPEDSFRQIGITPGDALKGNHINKMKSVKDAFNCKDTEKWLATLPKGTKVIAEDKADGVAMSITYDNGKVTKALTRGDGEIGTDITHLVRVISNIPIRFKTSGKFEIRGEIIITHKSFKGINRGRIVPYKNPRNLVTGSIDLKDVSEMKSRRLEFIAHGIGHTDIQFNTQTEIREFLVEHRFNVIEQVEFDVGSCGESYQTLIDNRVNKLFMIDGTVLKVDDILTQVKLGETNTYPKWALALKFPPSSASTTVLGITYQVGSTGEITPVGILTPVSLDSTVISRVNLHNIGYIETKDIRIGSEITIVKSGDIIPMVVSVSNPLKTSRTKPPRKCPECSHTLERKDMHVRCINNVCPGVLISTLTRFVNKKYFNIYGISEKTITKLVRANKLTTFTDIFLLDEDILTDAGFGKVEIVNILKEINLSREVEFDRFLGSLGIPGTSITIARKIYLELGMKLETYTQDDLMTIGGIGIEIATSIIFWLQSNYSLTVLPLMKQIKIIPPKCANKGGLLENLKFTFTGRLDLSRDKLTNIINSESGEVVPLSKDADYAIIGDNPSKAKSDKIDKLRIKRMDYATLEKFSKGELEVSASDYEAFKYLSKKLLM